MRDVTNKINDRTFFNTTIQITDDISIPLRYDEAIHKRILLHMPDVMRFRGIKSPDTITDNDSEVLALVKRATKGKKNISGKRLKRIKANAIKNIQIFYKTPYDEAMTQVGIWAIVSDLFDKPTRVKGLPRAVVKDEYLELDLPSLESYFDDQSTTDDDFDKALLSAHEDLEPTLPLPQIEFVIEQMIAYSTCLMKDYPEFGKAIVPYTKLAFTGVMTRLVADALDESGFLGDRVDELLDNILDERNPDDIGDDDDTRMGSGTDDTGLESPRLTGSGEDRGTEGATESGETPSET